MKTVKVKVELVAEILVDEQAGPEDDVVREYLLALLKPAIEEDTGDTVSDLSVVVLSVEDAEDRDAV